MSGQQGAPGAGQSARRNLTGSRKMDASETHAGSIVNALVPIRYLARYEAAKAALADPPRGRRVNVFICEGTPNEGLSRTPQRGPTRISDVGIDVDGAVGKADVLDSRFKIFFGNLEMDRPTFPTSEPTWRS